MPEAATLPTPEDVLAESPQLLQQATDYFGMLASAAAACEQNFAWMHEVNRERKHRNPNAKEAKVLLILDTELIFAAMMGSNNDGHFSRLTSPFEQISFDINPGNLIGPHILQHYLSTALDFTIPPGTATELLAKIEELGAQVAVPARRLIRELSSTTDFKSPGLGVLQYRRKYGSMLATTFSGIADRFAKMALIEDIVHRHTPYEEIKNSAVLPMGPIEEVFIHLKNRRPRYPKSNYLDALNLASIVDIFPDDPYGNDSAVWLPILVTNTKSVLGTHGIVESNLPLRQQHGMPRLICNFAYLHVSSMLCSYYAVDERGELPYEMLSNKASSLRISCAELERTANRLAERGVKHVKTSRGEAYGPIVDMLNELTQFEDEFGDILQEPDDLVGIDRTILINEIFSDQTAKSMAMQRGHRRNTAAQELKEELVHFRHPRYNLWKLLITFSQQNYDAIGIDKLRKHVQVMYYDDDGTPLAEISKKDLSDQFSADKRMAFILNPVSQSPVLVVDYYARGVNKTPTLKVTWCYEGESSEAWKHLSQAMHGLMLRNLGGTHPDAVYRVLSAEADDIADRIRLKDSHKLLDRHYVNPGYIDIAAEGFACSMDILPYEGKENQLSITLPKKYFTEESAHIILKVVEDTSRFVLAQGILADDFSAVATIYGPHLPTEL